MKNRERAIIKNMKQGNGNIYTILFVFAMLVIAGFFFVFDAIGTLRTDIKNVEMAFELFERNETEITKVEKENTSIPSTLENPPETQNEGIVVPTAILFKTLSSPSLLPRTDITLSVEKIVKMENGDVRVYFKAFTNEATGYSSIDPASLFQIISLEGDNLKPSSVDGQFSSMPPKSAVSGSVLFNPKEKRDTLILQTGDSGQIKFYEVNFLKKTYKETEIG